MAKDYRERFLSASSRLCRRLSARDERADGLRVRRASETRGLTQQQVCGEKQNCRGGGVVRALGWRELVTQARALGGRSRQGTDAGTTARTAREAESGSPVHTKLVTARGTVANSEKQD